MGNLTLAKTSFGDFPAKIACSARSLPSANPLAGTSPRVNALPTGSVYSPIIPSVSFRTRSIRAMFPFAFVTISLPVNAWARDLNTVNPFTPSPANAEDSGMPSPRNARIASFVFSEPRIIAPLVVSADCTIVLCPAFAISSGVLPLKTALCLATKLNTASPAFASDLTPSWPTALATLNTGFLTRDNGLNSVICIPCGSVSPRIFFGKMLSEYL